MTLKREVLPPTCFEKERSPICSARLFCGMSLPGYPELVANRLLTTPRGDVPIFADEVQNDAVVILAHGAGSHAENKTMLWLSDLVRSAGASVVRFNFLYRAQGKGMPDRMPVLMETYRAVIDSIRTTMHPKKLVIGGHSMGGRVASMVEAEQQTADGLLLFGYPLHPPGQPEKLRDAHLPQIKTPTLQLSGTNDEFCTPELMKAVPLDPSIYQIVWIEGADHSYSVKRSSGRTKADAENDIRSALVPWLVT